MRVDLPAPFSPMSACTSPASSSKETSLSAGTPRKLLEIPEPESTKRLPPIPASMDNSPSLGRLLNGRSPCARVLRRRREAETLGHVVVSGQEREGAGPSLKTLTLRRAARLPFARREFHVMVLHRDSFRPGFEACAEH